VNLQAIISADHPELDVDAVIQLLETNNWDESVSAYYRNHSHNFRPRLQLSMLRLQLLKRDPEPLRGDRRLPRVMSHSKTSWIRSDSPCNLHKVRKIPKSRVQAVSLMTWTNSPPSAPSRVGGARIIPRGLPRRGDRKRPRLSPIGSLSSLTIAMRSNKYPRQLLRMPWRKRKSQSNLCRIITSKLSKRPRETLRRGKGCLGASMGSSVTILDDSGVG
jgi:hypothetical protein